MGQASVHLTQLALKLPYCVKQLVMMANWAFQGHQFWYQSTVCNFLLVIINTDLYSILHHFWVIVANYHLWHFLVSAQQIQHTHHGSCYIFTE